MAKTLYRAKLGVELEKQTKEKCPRKLLYASYSVTNSGK
jgi:hypothetical protein